MLPASTHMYICIYMRPTGLRMRLMPLLLHAPRISSSRTPPAACSPQDTHASTLPKSPDTRAQPKATHSEKNELISSMTKLNHIDGPAGTSSQLAQALPWHQGRHAQGVMCVSMKACVSQPLLVALTVVQVLVLLQLHGQQVPHRRLLR